MIALTRIGDNQRVNPFPALLLLIVFGQTLNTVARPIWRVTKDTLPVPGETPNQEDPPSGQDYDRCERNDELPKE
jgi:hypothetical protein